MKDAARTFHWLVDILDRHGVSFVVTGGLAAKSYGAQRDLNDIDVDIRTGDFEKILADIARYIVFGPAQFRDAQWDLPLITLRHDGQDIDIGGDRSKILEAGTGSWIALVTDFDDIESRMIFGRLVPVMSRKALMDYKSLLARPVDLADIAAIGVKNVL
jgi:hypothetical protein